MAGKQPPAKEPKNIVHQNAILCETVAKEHRYQKFFTNYTVNPYRRWEGWKKKWKNLRDTYIKKKRERRKYWQSAPNKKPWLYYDIMTFLDESTEQRSMECKSLPPSTPDDEESVTGMVETFPDCERCNGKTEEEQRGSSPCTTVIQESLEPLVKRARQAGDSDSDAIKEVMEEVKKDLFTIAGKPNQKVEEGEEDDNFLQVIKRANQEPVKKYKYPQTESQEIGWISKPLLKTDREDIRLNFFRHNSPITKFMDKAWLEKEQQNMGN